MPHLTVASLLSMAGNAFPAAGHALRALADNDIFSGALRGALIGGAVVGVIMYFFRKKPK